MCFFIIQFLLAFPVLPDSILDSRPTEPDINKLVGSRMSAEWDKLAMYLKFDSNTRQAIDRDNNGKCGRCFSNVGSSWLESKEGTGDLPRTWRSVLQAVRDCGHRGLADDVRVSLSGEQCVCVCVCVCVGRWVHMYVCVCRGGRWVHTYLYMYMHAHTCVYVCVCVCVCVCTCLLLVYDGVDNIRHVFHFCLGH